MSMRCLAGTQVHLEAITFAKTATPSDDMGLLPKGLEQGATNDTDLLSGVIAVQ